MSNGNTQLIQQKRTVNDLINSDRARLEIAKVLPKHLTPERMTRVALTATLKNPLLLSCNPESLMNALLICSQAGLEPDGRLAHLIPFGNQAQVIFDYKGLVTLALRNGAESVYADTVCEYDEFNAWVENGDKKLTHRPNWSKPRGTPVCYYSVCKRKGEIDWEVMSVDEVSAIRKRSKCANQGPWVTDFDEMAKKTVLRRMSKRWDLLPEIRDVINADDDTPPPFNVQTTKPVFTSPTQLVAPPQESIQPEPGPETGENPNDSARQPENEDAPVKALRHLCKTAKVKEGELLEFLSATGSTDGSISTLEELAIQQPEVLAMVSSNANWGDISKRIIQARKGSV